METAVGKQVLVSVTPWVMFHLLAATRSEGDSNRFGPLDTAMVLSCYVACIADSFSRSPVKSDALCLDKLAALVALYAEVPALFKV